MCLSSQVNRSCCILMRRAPLNFSDLLAVIDSLAWCRIEKAKDKRATMQRLLLRRITPFTDVVCVGRIGPKNLGLQAEFVSANHTSLPVCSNFINPLSAMRCLIFFLRNIVWGKSACFLLSTMRTLFLCFRNYLYAVLFFSCQCFFLKQTSYDLACLQPCIILAPPISISFILSLSTLSTRNA